MSNLFFAAGRPALATCVRTMGAKGIQSKKKKKNRLKDYFKKKKKVSTTIAPTCKAPPKNNASLKAQGHSFFDP